jgi:hypothetical protein
MKIRKYIIILLIAFCIWGVYEVWNVPNMYEIIMGEIFFLPFELVLISMCLSFVKKDIGWSKKIDILGIVVVIFSWLVVILSYLKEYIRYHS